MARFDEVRERSGEQLHAAGNLTPGLGALPAAGRSRPAARSSRPTQDATATDWIGLGEASRILGISEGTLRRWADEGRVSVFTTPGGHRRFSRRALRNLLPAERAHRPTLAHLGASPARIVRGYRPATSRLARERAEQPAIAEAAGAAAPGGAAPWMQSVPEDALPAFRERGRALVAALLEHLDAPDPRTADARLQDACQLAAEHGRQMASLGASLTDAIQAFLQFRSPFVDQLAGIARRRGLDTREATELLVQAESAMDRLLVATMTGHTLAAGSRRTEAGA